MLRILSVDIGWRNLASVKLELYRSNGNNTKEDLTAEDFNILSWKIDSLLDDTVNVNETSLDELIKITVPSLAKVIEEWSSWPSLLGSFNDKPDIVFLEQQPLGMQARNVKTKTLSHVIQSLLISKNIPVFFISPQKKLKFMSETSSSSYSANKKFAVEETVKILQHAGASKWIDFLHSFKKQDDLADCFLQGLYGGRDHLATIEKEKFKEEKRKRKLNAKLATHVEVAAISLSLTSSGASGASGAESAEPIRKRTKRCKNLTNSIPISGGDDACHDIKQDQKQQDQKQDKQNKQDKNKKTKIKRRRKKNVEVAVNKFLECEEI